MPKATLFSSLSSAGLPKMGLMLGCICFHSLLDKDSLMNIGIVTNIRVKQNIVRHHFLTYFFINHVWFYPRSLAVQLCVLVLQQCQGWALILMGWV